MVLKMTVRHISSHNLTPAEGINELTAFINAGHLCLDQFFM